MLVMRMRIGPRSLCHKDKKLGLLLRNKFLKGGGGGSGWYKMIL